MRLVDVSGNPEDPAQLNPMVSAAPVAFDRGQIVARSDSFQALVQGKAFGSQVGKVDVTADSIVYTELTNIGGAFQQRSTVVVNADLSMRRSDQTSTVQSQQTETHLAYANGRVTGTSMSPQPNGTPKSITVDTTVTPATIDDNALSVFLPALPLEPGKTFNLSVFSSGDGVTKTVSVKVGAIENVAVPAGTFPAYRLELSGMQLPIVMHVTQQAPRRVPHGVTLIGRLFEEGTLGRAGLALEEAFNVMAERPPGF